MIRRVWGVLLGLAGLGCATPRSAPTAAAVVPPPSAPPLVEPVPPPLVALPPQRRFPANDAPAGPSPANVVPVSCERGERPKVAVALDAVCLGGAGGSCKTCPSYTGLGGEPGMHGRLEVLSRGNFSGQGSEMLVKVLGCEAHAQNWGGTVLVRQQPAGWEAIWYAAGFAPHECQLRVGPDGQQLLACLESYGYNGPTYDTAATLIDLKRGHAQQVYYSMCEHGRDVVKVAWGKAPDVDVLLTVRQVKKAPSEERGCPKDRGPERLLKIGYVAQNDEYQPNAQGVALLRSLVPEEDVDPSVRSAVLSAPLPADVRPAPSKPFDPAPIGPCQ